jgi:hypothetical protein
MGWDITLCSDKPPITKEQAIEIANDSVSKTVLHDAKAIRAVCYVKNKSVPIWVVSYEGIPLIPKGKAAKSGNVLIVVVDARSKKKVLSFN